MNEIKLINVGGVDLNIKDQYVRDIIAPSENGLGLDSSTNLPVSSRHYDEGDYLIAQDRKYYEAITDIDVGDTLVVGTNIRATTVTEEILMLKGQSANVAIETIADMETAATASKAFATGKYVYWNYGVDYGMYEVIADIAQGDAFTTSGNSQNIKPANKIGDDVSLLKRTTTNPNLLDNPWFTVNQRGQSSYSSTTNPVYSVDRWYIYGGSGTITCTPLSEGINLVADASADGNQLASKLILPHLTNKNVTLSINVNGTIYSKTEKIAQRTASWERQINIITTEGVTCELWNAPTSEANIDCTCLITVPKDGNTYTITAVKLELGSRSTLSNDVAPNYTEELLKCQRYYYRTNMGRRNTYSLIGLSRVLTNSLVEVFVNMPCVMRNQPSIILNGTPRFIGTVDTIPTNPTTISTNSNNLIKGIRISGFSNMVPGDMGIMIFNDAVGEACIELTADL